MEVSDGIYGSFTTPASVQSINFNNAFNTTKVKSMSSMFAFDTRLSILDLSNFNTSQVTDMSIMFFNCSALSTTINIMSSNITSYAGMFDSAAKESGAQITVNYIADASTLVDNMIATKSKTSNVVKGNEIQ